MQAEVIDVMPERPREERLSEPPVSEEPPVSAPEPAPTVPPLPRRLVSLDAFRGLTIFGMLLVNNIALNDRTPKQLLHAPWNGGLHFADLVFPWFLLIVGVAIPFAWASYRKKGEHYLRYLLKALSRTIWLVLLGCLIDSSVAKRPLFDLDVLQLIGLAYFVATLAYSLSPIPRLMLGLTFLFGHAALIRYGPVPGAPAGTFRPTENVINYINAAYLARVHLQGVISVVPASALVLIGTALGDVLRMKQIRMDRRALILVAAGLVLEILGSLWNLSLPFNKPVWTASYILFTAGVGSIVLGVMYLLVDVLGARPWVFPLVVFGTNPIVAYVLPILAKLYILQVWTWAMPDGTHPNLQQAILHGAIIHYGPWRGGWTYTLGYIGLCWLVVCFLYLRRIFVRV